ncbi:MAG: UDP-3-O-(3-hydroxymyristoyl)glucosamine N-acyltransferase [Vulcanimicrobiota bacterium]
MRKILSSLKLSELAKKLDGELKGDDIAIIGTAGIDEDLSDKITWVENKKALDQAKETNASAYIISRWLYEEKEEEIEKPCILVDIPRFAYALTLRTFYTRDLPCQGISEKAHIGKNVKLGKNITIGHFAYIGDDSVIEDEAVIYPHTYIGKNVKVGTNSIVYPFATIYNGCRIGNDVIIHSGAVIGADGFGFVEVKGKKEKIPQVGIVELCDGVEIGANVTIDRATTNVTRLGENTKIDNLVQIGHNCKLGKNCIIVSQSGLAGSCVLGNNVTMAAQTGTVPHIKIGSNTLVAGRGGVTHDISGNTVISGFPAKPHREALRIRAAAQLLPNTMHNVKELEKRIATLERKIEELENHND